MNDIKTTVALKPFLAKFAKDTPEPNEQDGACGAPSSRTTPTMRTKVNGETTDDS